MNVSSFLEELTRWAAARPDIIAVGLVGSHARGTARPDSDVDVVILSARAAALLEDDWPTAFGEVESRTVEHYGALQSVRVFYRNGLEVEFAVAAPEWAGTPLDPGTRAVLSAGAHVLHDPKRVLERARYAALAPQA